MPTPKPTISAKTIALYDALVATQPSVERKGATMPYTAVNGNMFSFLTPDGTLALRLPEAECEVFLKRYRTKLCQQHGVVMKEYVAVPPELLARTNELSGHFATSFRFASSLKQKATTRSKAAKPAARLKSKDKAKSSSTSTSGARPKRFSSDKRSR